MDGLNKTDSESNPSWLIFGSNFLVCVLIITNNVLLLITIIRTPKLRTLPNAYIVSLGVADLLVGFVLAVRHFWLIPETQWVFDENKFVCLPFSCLLYTSEAASLMSLVWLSLDRYLYIVWPYWYERNVTSRRVKWTMSVSWTLCIALGSLPLVLNDFTPEKGCNGIAVISDVFFISLVVYFFLSASIITVMYSWIFVVVVKQRKKILVQTASVRQSASQTVHSQWRAVRSFFLVCVLFYLCFLPLIFTTFFHFAHKDSDTLVNVAVSTAAFNSALNFFVFLALNKDFRSAIKAILCRNRERVSAVSPHTCRNKQQDVTPKVSSISEMMDNRQSVAM